LALEILSPEQYRSKSDQKVLKIFTLSNVTYRFPSKNSILLCFAMMIPEIRPARRITVFIWAFFLTVAFNSHPLPASAAVTKTLHIEWAYDTSFPDLAGYRIYQDGIQVLEISDPFALAADVTLLLENPSTSLITMTAFDVYGQESAPSEPYPLAQAEDSDSDGISDISDNCPSTVNPDQLDVDRDGLGDGCDPDIDGDGLTNLEEYDLGTDPMVADSDGDGVVDGFDGYPFDARSDLCVDLIRNNSTQKIFTSVQDAIDDPNVVDYDTIEMTAADFEEDVLYDRNAILILSGGYYCTYSDNPALSSIKSLTIGNGTIIADNLLIY
jgi:hypothetical protein